MDLDLSLIVNVGLGVVLGLVILALLKILISAASTRV